MDRQASADAFDTEERISDPDSAQHGFGDEFEAAHQDDVREMFYALAARIEKLEARAGAEAAHRAAGYDESNASTAGWIIIASIALFAGVTGVLIYVAFQKAANGVPSTTHSAIADYILLGPTGLYCLGLLALASRLATRESTRIRMAEAKGSREMMTTLRMVYRELAELVAGTLKRTD